MKKAYEEFASENKGIFRIGSVDCDDQGPICVKENIGAFPTFRIYPQFPVPIQDFEVADSLDKNALKKRAGKFIQDKSIEITNNNHQTFVDEDPGTPKVILFTNSKKGTPFVYRALSQHFEVSPIADLTPFRKHCNSV